MGRTGAFKVDLNAAHIEDHGESCTDSSIVYLYTCSDLWTQSARSSLTTWPTSH